MTATASRANDAPRQVGTRNPAAPRRGGSPGGRSRRGRLAVQGFLAVMALLWIFPVAYAVLASFRDYAYTAEHGYLSFGGFTLQNYKDAWSQANFSQTMVNSAIVTIPAVLLTLFLSCCIAFVVARFSFRFNLALLGLFTAANLLPPQALLIPVYRMFRAIEVPFWFSESGTLLNSYWGLIAVNVAFQTGFCAFVLSNYMKALPRELYESAVVDGASVTRQFFQITLPLCRPALAALATLQVTWIYNEFFWATVLLQSGDKFPVTSSLNNLRGEFFTDNNLVAAGSVVVALPTLIVFFVLQKQFVAGLTLGATKG
jgi:multiple sugar transport system permease protein